MRVAGTVVLAHGRRRYTYVHGVAEHGCTRRGAMRAGKVTVCVLCLYETGGCFGTWGAKSGSDPLSASQLAVCTAHANTLPTRRVAWCDMHGSHVARLGLTQPVSGGARARIDRMACCRAGFAPRTWARPGAVAAHGRGGLLLSWARRLVLFYLLGRPLLWSVVFMYLHD